MKEVTLTLNTDEINLVLESLGGMPYMRSFAIIGKIQSQAGEQLNRVAENGTKNAKKPEAELVK